MAANYHYDEGGNMAAYFVLSVLALFLIPATFSLSSSSRTNATAPGCQCKPCIERRALIVKRQRGSLWMLNLGKKAVFVVVGWSLFAFLAYKVAGAKIENKVYDPFEILGLRAGVTEKEIKSHFKKLSRKFHPDKVKPTANLTMEAIESYFVEITKAYKSLTNENIRKNWELYGHPDGRQEVTTGIALPAWIVESRNNIWVLGVYGLLFGGALPALVGRWWFGSREKTKDGIRAPTASAFFKSLKEESGINDAMGTLVKAFEWERSNRTTKAQEELDDLERQIESRLHDAWTDVRDLANTHGTHETRRKALILIYAHLLRIPINNASLRDEQVDILLQTPLLLNALLNIATSRSWLSPTLSIMRLHAYIVQALQPGNERLRFAQLPNISNKEASELVTVAGGLDDVVRELERRGDGRQEDARVAARTWGSLELVDASFKVIGERVVTPSSIVFLVVKLRLSPPQFTELSQDLSTEPAPSSDEDDDEFLVSRKDAEDLDQANLSFMGAAHAPYWPASRRPAWWLVLADEKPNKVVVPPMKVVDVPFSDRTKIRNYRSYKLQFQAPPNAGLFTWKLYLVSDTFIDGQVVKDLALKVDDASTADLPEDPADDEISEPDEDTLAGQMAAMRGGSVKRHDTFDGDSSDDDEFSDHGSSDSDSD